jgi:hypothetical protein
MVRISHPGLSLRSNARPLLRELPAKLYKKFMRRLD